jgi:hypothetical protein
MVYSPSGTRRVALRKLLVLDAAGSLKDLETSQVSASPARS